jgi:hypothetical protein
MPRIAEVAFFTDDVPGLTAFYERLLGRSPASRSESHACFDLEGTTLFIHVLGEGDHEGSPNADHVALALDQDAAALRMRSAGVDVVGPKDYYWGRSAYLHDPDGRGRGASGRQLTQAIGDERRLGPEPVQLGSSDRQATNVSLSADPSGALAVLSEQRPLAEDVTRSKLVLSVARLDDRVTLLEHENPGARGATFDERPTRGRVELRRCGCQAIELLVVEIREQRQSGESVAH